MAYLPGFFDKFVVHFGWSQSQMITYLSLYYLLIGTYSVLVVLTLLNTWSIVLRRSEYRNLPILMFYLFGLIATSLRLIVIVIAWTPYPVMFNMDYIQQVTKLCVGVVQDWITLELAIRIRNSKGHSNISDSTKKRLKVVRSMVFAAITALFAIYCTVVTVSAHKEKNKGLAFGRENNCLVVSTIGYLFLCQVILMTLLVAWLFIET